MKITIKDFGPISHFEFDLQKKITFIFGSNSVGKSYAISTVYLLIKNLNLLFRRMDTNFYLPHYRHFFKGGIAPALKGSDQLQKILKNLSLEADITDISALALKNFIEASFCDAFAKSLETSFGSLDTICNFYSKTSAFQIFIEGKNFDFELSYIRESARVAVKNLKFKNRKIIRKARTYREPFTDSAGNDIFYFNQVDQAEDVARSTLLAVIGRASSNLAENLLENVSETYFFPASRSGLYQALSTFSAVIAELSQSRNFLRNKIELPNIPEQVSDYFLDLSSIDSKVKITESASKISKVFEDEILGGKIVFDSETKKLFFNPKDKDILLELISTSSMVSEIAPIVAFLKYILFKPSHSMRKRNILLFIEEPEAHLHPENQIKFLEHFLNLINFDVKVVITSHSNYMFNKLNNLIIKKVITKNHVATCLMKVTNEGSISDYESMRPTEQGIQDNNFLATSEKLFNELTDE